MAAFHGQVPELLALPAADIEHGARGRANHLEQLRVRRERTLLQRVRGRDFVLRPLLKTEVVKLVLQHPFVAEMKAKAMADIGQIATETAEAIVAQLTGESVSQDKVRKTITAMAGE